MLIDISGSMNNDNNLDGLPDGTGPAIFDLVQEAINRFIGGLPRGSNIVIIPFGNQVNPDNLRRYTLDASGGRVEAQAFVSSLVALDSETRITESVSVALSELQALRADDDRPHIQSVLLYTDGIGNGPDDLIGGAPSVDELLNRLGAYRADQPFLFVKYVALGLEVPNAEQLEDSGIVKVFEEAPGVVSEVREVRLSIPRADLGTMQPNEPRSLRLCAASGELSAGVPLRFSLNQDGLPGDMSAVLAPAEGTLGPDGVEMVLTVRRPEQSGSEGRQTVEVRVETTDPLVILAPAAIPVSFLLAPPP
ncbi:MAG: VWA domain-containing protein, partial [Thermomicrobiales bacterium]|nr:VWA domain-containing protein [Thermomicrobiales bacterium]